MNGLTLTQLIQRDRIEHTIRKFLRFFALRMTVEPKIPGAVIPPRVFTQPGYATGAAGLACGFMSASVPGCVKMAPYQRQSRDSEFCNHGTPIRVESAPDRPRCTLRHTAGVYFVTQVLAQLRRPRSI